MIIRKRSASPLTGPNPKRMRDSPLCELKSSHPGWFEDYKGEDPDKTLCLTTKAVCELGFDDIKVIADAIKDKDINHLKITFEGAVFPAIFLQEFVQIQQSGLPYLELKLYDVNVFPDEFFMPSLQTMDIRWTHSDLDNQQLFSEQAFDGMCNLEILDFSYSTIEGLPPLFMDSKAPNLHTLGLTGCKAIDKPSLPGSDRFLKVLEIEDVGSEWGAYATFVQTLTALEELTIDFIGPSVDTDTFVKTIEQLPSLQWLIINPMLYEDDELKYFEEIDDTPDAGPILPEEMPDAYQTALDGVNEILKQADRTLNIVPEPDVYDWCRQQNYSHIRFYKARQD